MDIAATGTLLRSVLTRPMGEHSTQETIHKIAAVLNPEVFFSVGVSVLESLPDSPQRPRAYARLLECQEFLLELIRIGRYSDTELKDLCADWIKIDCFLDVRLARLAPGRHEDEVGLTSETVARVLQVLHHISEGPRLISLVNHLKHSPCPLVAEKATVLVGRRIRNLGWVRQRLESPEAHIRAAAVEGLWGIDTPGVRLLLRQSRTDHDSQVVANALIGLHFLGEIGARQWVKEMAVDERFSFRRCAVWAMGQMGEPEFQEPLREAMADSEPEVRLGAKQALAALRKLAQEAPPVPAPEPLPATPVKPERADRFSFRYDGSFHVTD